MPKSPQVAPCSIGAARFWPARFTVRLPFPIPLSARLNLARPAADFLAAVANSSGEPARQAQSGTFA
jgi:hypothetical protein